MQVVRSAHFCEKTKAFSTMDFRDVTALSGAPGQASIQHQHASAVPKRTTPLHSLLHFPKHTGPPTNLLIYKRLLSPPPLTRRLAH